MIPAILTTARMRDATLSSSNITLFKLLQAPVVVILVVVAVNSNSSGGGGAAPSNVMTAKGCQRFWKLIMIIFALATVSK
jgi:hypothetical protein